MWLTVLVLACVATADPLRIGVGVALSSRRQAVGPLAAFWLGGMAVSAVLAAVVLFGVRDTALATMHRMQVATASATAGSSSDRNPGQMPSSQPGKPPADSHCSFTANNRISRIANQKLGSAMPIWVSDITPTSPSRL